MKALLTGICAVVILSALSSSFENIDQSEEEQLKKLEYDWAAAMSKGDTATLSTLLAKESITVFADTALPTHLTMGYAIDSHTERAKKNIKYTEKIDEVNVEIFGNSAILYGYFSMIEEDKGQVSQSPKYRFYDMANKIDGKWKFVSMGAYETNEVKEHQKKIQEQNRKDK